MPRLPHAVLAFACLAMAAHAGSETLKPIQYPDTRRDEIVETMFGEKIADPYRWLENDVRSDKEVAGWVERQNKVTQAYLETLPERAWFANRIRSLIDYERFGLPVKAGKRYFYTRNTGLQNQSQLFVRDGLKGTPRLLVDPNSWAKDGATALDDWKPSEDGRYLLYSVQDGGTDWRILRVLDVQTGKQLADELRWAKFTTLAWVGNEGFFYSRFPKPEEGQDFQARNYNQAIYFHRIGTTQDADELVYSTPDQPENGHSAEVTEDGHHAIITSSKGTDSRYELDVIDLARRSRDGWKAKVLVSGFENDWKLVDGMGTRLWFVTNWNAPRYRLVSMDLAARKPEWQQLVGENAETLQQATIIGNKLILAYLKDASTRALVFDLTGKPANALALNDIGTASGFRGKPGGRYR